MRAALKPNPRIEALVLDLTLKLGPRDAATAIRQPYIVVQSVLLGLEIPARHYNALRNLARTRDYKAERAGGRSNRSDEYKHRRR